MNKILAHLPSGQGGAQVNSQSTGIKNSGSFDKIFDDQLSEKQHSEPKSSGTTVSKNQTIEEKKTVTSIPPQPDQTDMPQGGAIVSSSSVKGTQVTGKNSSNINTTHSREKGSAETKNDSLDPDGLVQTTDSQESIQTGNLVIAVTQNHDTISEKNVEKKDNSKNHDDGNNQGSNIDIASNQTLGALPAVGAEAMDGAVQKSAADTVASNLQPSATINQSDKAETPSKQMNDSRVDHQVGVALDSSDTIASSSSSSDGGTSSNQEGRAGQGDGTLDAASVSQTDSGMSQASFQLAIPQTMSIMSTLPTGHENTLIYTRTDEAGSSYSNIPASVSQSSSAPSAAILMTQDTEGAVQTSLTLSDGVASPVRVMVDDDSTGSVHLRIETSDPHTLQELKSNQDQLYTLLNQGPNVAVHHHVTFELTQPVGTTPDAAFNNSRDSQSNAQNYAGYTDSETGGGTGQQNTGRGASNAETTANISGIGVSTDTPNINATRWKVGVVNITA